MKTPEEFKKNLIACMDEAIEVAEDGDAHDLLYFAHHAHALMSETLTYIQQLEAELAAVRTERNAAVKDLQSHMECAFCKHDGTEADMGQCKTCFHVGGGGFSKRNWQWRGVCPENTEVQEDDH